VKLFYTSRNALSLGLSPKGREKPPFPTLGERAGEREQIQDELDWILDFFLK
jgi:hypothetical protein